MTRRRASVFVAVFCSINLCILGGEQCASPESCGDQRDIASVFLLQKKLAISKTNFSLKSIGKAGNVTLADVSNYLEFIHIPKNAGTSIVNAGRKHGIYWSQFHFTLPLPWLGQNGFAAHVPPHLWPMPHSNESVELPVNAYLGKETFCCTREPYGRLISIYKYMLQQVLDAIQKNPKEAPTGDVIDPSITESRSLAVMDLLNASMKNGMCTPRGFNLWARGLMEKILRTPFFRYADTKSFFVPQTEYIWGPDGRKWCDNVIRVEDLPEAFDELMKITGLSVRLGEKENPSSLCGSLTPEDIASDVKALIETVFRDDFTRLGYPMMTSGIR